MKKKKKGNKEFHTIRFLEDCLTGQMWLVSHKIQEGCPILCGEYRYKIRFQS